MSSATGRFCSCGRIVSGGGVRHFERDGHDEIDRKAWLESFWIGHWHIQRKRVGWD